MYDDMNVSTVTRHSTWVPMYYDGSTSQNTVSDCQHNVKMGSKLDIIFYIIFSKRVAGIYCFPGSPLGCALEKIE